VTAKSIIVSVLYIMESKFLLKYVRKLYIFALLFACGSLFFGKAWGPAASTSMQQLQMR